jgi:hypothetical protein
MLATLVNSFIVNGLSPKRTMVKRFMRVKTELVCTVPYPSYPISEKRSFVRPGLLGTARFREQRPSRCGWSLRRRRNLGHSLRPGGRRRRTRRRGLRVGARSSRTVTNPRKNLFRCIHVVTGFRFQTAYYTRNLSAHFGSTLNATPRQKMR